MRETVSMPWRVECSGGQDHLYSDQTLLQDKCLQRYKFNLEILEQAHKQTPLLRAGSVMTGPGPNFGQIKSWMK